MKRLLIAALGLLPTFAHAQDPAVLELKKALANSGRWGIAPSFTTAGRPTCNTSNLRGLIYNTTTSKVEFCNGTSYVNTVFGGTVSIGDTVSGGGANAVLFESATETLAADAANLFWNTTANGNFLRIGAGTSPGAIRLLEGSGGGTNYIALAAPAALAGNRAVTFLDLDQTLAGSAAALTATRMVFVGTGGLLDADADCAFATDTLTCTWIKASGGELALNADYTNATASFSNTAIVTPALTSGATYNFTMVMMFADSVAADGAQFDFNQGTATVTNFRASCHASNAAGAALALTNGATTALATAVQVTLALTTQAQLTCQGTFTPSSAGTFGIRAAQTAHTTGTLTVFRGSWLSMRVANPL